MHNLLLITLISSLITLLHAQQTSPSEDDNEELLQQLFNSREKKEFTTAYTQAQQNKISPQVLLEAKFLYHVDRDEHQEIINLTKAFQKMAPQFDAKVSKVFSSKQDWQSVIEFGLALKALEQNNIPLFKKHIQEAFWLSPDKAGAFSPHIQQVHTRRAMQKIKLKLDQPIYQVDQAKPTSLKNLLENNKAVILRFWSPWNQRINESLPALQHLAQQCKTHQVKFASILISKDPQGLHDTLEIIKENGKQLPSAWLADENDGRLTKLLRITELPTLVIIDKAGKVRFHGTPFDRKLYQILKEINPDFKEPQ